LANTPYFRRDCTTHNFSSIIQGSNFGSEYLKYFWTMKKGQIQRTVLVALSILGIFLLIWFFASKLYSGGNELKDTLGIGSICNEDKVVEEIDTSFRRFLPSQATSLINELSDCLEEKEKKLKKDSKIEIRKSFRAYESVVEIKVRLDAEDYLAAIKAVETTTGTISDPQHKTEADNLNI